MGLLITHYLCDAPDGHRTNRSYDCMAFRQLLIYRRVSCSGPFLWTWPRTPFVNSEPSGIFLGCRPSKAGPGSLWSVSYDTPVRPIEPNLQNLVVGTVGMRRM